MNFVSTVSINTMNSKNSKHLLRRVVAAALIASIVCPAAMARGGFGGGRGFGGGFGGDRGFGGGFGDRGFGDRGFGDRGFGDGDRGFGDRGFGDRGMDSGFGGRVDDRPGGYTGAGFDGAAGNRGYSGVQNYSWPRSGVGEGGGFANRPVTPITGRPNMPNKLPSDGGFGGLNGNHPNWGGHQGNVINRNDPSSVTAQGNGIRNSFDGGNTFNRNTTVNQYGGIHGGYGNWGGYGRYGGYWHPGYGWGYGHGFWGYPGGWYYPGWTQAYAWTSMGLSTLTSFLGIAAIAGMEGNGGGNGSSTTNITYQGDTVYENGSQLASAPQFYQQSQALAAQGFNTPSPGSPPGNEPVAEQMQVVQGHEQDEFKPLGVFALAEPNQKDSDMIFQLAIDHNGVIRGNYFNQISNEQSQVYGAVDKKSQRVSWSIGTTNKTTFDTTLGNLTKKDSPILVHYGPTSTRQMYLFKLNPPSGGNQTQTQVPTQS